MQNILQAPATNIKKIARSKEDSGAKRKEEKENYNKMGWAHEMLIIFFISLAWLADVI